jgi:hypothetical protein
MTALRPEQAVYSPKDIWLHNNRVSDPKAERRVMIGASAWRQWKRRSDSPIRKSFLRA